MKIEEKKRWLFFGLPLTFTTYEITDEQLVIKEGLLTRKENSCYMYKIMDVELRLSVFERIFGLGTVICYTGDVTHEKIELIHIKNSKKIRDAIFETSEAQRIKRRTVNMQTIDSNDIEV